jgi:hypothetical protein
VTVLESNGNVDHGGLRLQLTTEPGQQFQATANLADGAECGVQWLFMLGLVT